MKTNTLTMLLLLALTACGDKDEPTDTDTDADTDTDYDFATDDPSAYTRVDRAGMPAINTAVIASKDLYNASNPSDDASFAFAGEIIGSLSFLHGALDDDLAAANLTPCTVVGDGTGSCVAVAAGLVLPDTLKVDVTGAAGFPNGRALPDPVIDVTLAVVLLEIADGTHTPFDLVGINPTANDVSFDTAFPYLAAPHE